MLRTIVLFLLAAPVLWGCVSLDQYSALREAYNKLDKERTSTQAAAQAAKNESAKVSGELNRVRQEMKDLEAKLQKTNQEMTELSAQLDTAKKALAAKEEERAKPAKEAKQSPRGKKP